MTSLHVCGNQRDQREQKKPPSENADERRRLAYMSAEMSPISGKQKNTSRGKRK